MRTRSFLQVGKLPPALLQGLLRECRAPASSRVVIGPRYGEDAAVIDMGAKYLVAKTDPITFTEERIGWYAVNINANDIATLGATPRWFLATLLLPDGRATRQMARRIFRDIVKTCRGLNIALCGGHTEITTGLPRPIVVGQMLGEVEKSQLVRKESQRPGDLIILTRGVAIEGTTILARARGEELRKMVGHAVVKRARGWLLDPGISVVRDARLALRYGKVHAMHDPTEGGLLSGLAEIALAGHVGLRIWKERIPVFPETLAFSQALKFDPLALIASGALLIVAAPASVPSLLRAYSRRGIPAAVIGEIRSQKEEMAMVEKGRATPLRPPQRDEIARLLESN
ncbi:MAG TPA: AIR synthase family protein [Terriglobia bacterium]|nr:AIR synthase family protein [Terriglobia bacterium]